MPVHGVISGLAFKRVSLYFGWLGVSNKIDTRLRTIAYTNFP